MPTGEAQEEDSKIMTELQVIPARRGKATRLAKGQVIKIINTHGTQVVDFWAFVAGQTNEYLGMEHCRATWTRLYPVVGDKMYTNHRRPILTLEHDTSPGRHDTVMAPCDNERYGLLGCNDYHDNCRDNLHAGLYELGIYIPYTPASLNLFMNIPVKDGLGGRFWTLVHWTNWRVGFPMTAAQQERVAREIVAELRAGRLVQMLVTNLPKVELNHTVVAFGYRQTARGVEFAIWDPNEPGAAGVVLFDEARRRFWAERMFDTQPGVIRAFRMYYSWLW